jgi:hypothetical protein
VIRGLGERWGRKSATAVPAPVEEGA